MSSKRSDIIFSLLSIPVDAGMVFLSFLAAYWLRSQTEILQIVYLWPLRDYLTFVLLMLPFWIIVFALAGLYGTSAAGGRRAGNFTKIFLAVSAGIMFFVVWVFLSRTLFFSRLIVVYAWVLAIIFVTIGRFILRLAEQSLYRYGVGIRNVLIIGKTEAAETLKQELETNRGLGYRVINGLVEPKLPTIKKFITNNRIDEILLTDSDLPVNQVLEFIAFSEEHLITFRLVPNLFEVKSANVEIQTLAAVPIIEYRRTPLSGWTSLLKRLFDLLVSTLVLVVLSPVYLIIAFLIKLDSPGPVFYRHKRLGFKRQSFFLYKFRTMKLEYCTGDAFTGKSDEEILAKDLKKPELVKQFLKDYKLKDDPRVTNMGRLLRRTSLDELPQFFNVWLGQLSLVGPRPIVTGETDKYGEYQHRLFIIKPGVTGLWQVSGRSDMPYSERVKLDMYYIENWSLWMDLIIVIKTFFVILLRRNAY